MRILFVAFLLLCCADSAYSAVTVVPKRVVFEGRDRSAEINLINSGDKEEPYRIFFQEKTMLETGEFRTLDKTPSYSAEKMIAYSPRQVVIPPRSSQTIRIIARKPKNIASGEYRSHLSFQSIPDNKDNALSKKSLQEGEVEVNLTPIFGLSIPVIIRHGNMVSNVEICELSPKLITSSIIDIRLCREGKSSSYGNFIAYYSISSAEEILVGTAKGVAVYAENSSRSFKLPLTPPENVTLESGGKIRVRYEEEDGTLLAEAETVIP